MELGKRGAVENGSLLLETGEPGLRAVTQGWMLVQLLLQW